MKELLNTLSLESRTNVENLFRELLNTNSGIYPYMIYRIKYAIEKTFSPKQFCEFIGKITKDFQMELVGTTSDRIYEIRDAVAKALNQEIEWITCEGHGSFAFSEEDAMEMLRLSGFHPEIALSVSCAKLSENSKKEIAEHTRE